MNLQQKVKKTICILTLIVLTAGIVCLPQKKVMAASAAMNLSLSEENIMVDSTFSVVVTVEASEDIGDFECFLSFDSEMLEFVSGAAFVSSGNGLVMISDKDSKNESGNKKYSMKFKAIKSGETNMWIEDEVEISCALDGAGMSLSRNQLVFNIKDPDEIGDDTSLSKLSISPGTLTPVFKQGTNKFEAEVSSSVRQIAVEAAATDENAVISIKGNTDLKAGKNTISITVTAPSGKKDVSKIIVTKEEEIVDSDVGSSEKKEDVIASTGVKAIEDKSGTRFLTEELRLQMLPAEDSLIPKDYIKTTIVLDGIPITVYTWKYDLDSDLLLVYGMNQDGESSFYQYDRVNNSLQKYTGDSAAEEKTQSKTAVKEDSKDNSSKQLTQMAVVIAVLGAACICLTVALVLKIIKKPKKIEEKEDDFF